MKIVNKSLGKAADVSAARGSAFSELRRLLLLAVLLAVGVYYSIGFVVDTVVARISFESEAKLFGSGIVPDFHHDADDPRLKRARFILQKLTTDPRLPSLPFNLILVQNESPNAFAFPGGTIGITDSLIDMLEEEIALAFVLGHEIGHFHNRDHLQGYGRAIGVGILFSILFGGQMGNDALGSMFHSVLSKNYTRGQEVKADRFGVGMVHGVYGKTEGVDRLFSILDEKGGMPDWAYMLTTHPSPGDRILDLKKHSRELVVNSGHDMR